MRKLFALLLAFLLLTTNALAADIYVDTWKVETGAPPTVTGDQVLAPAQDIFAALGATATLDPATSSVLAVRGATQIWIQAGNPTAFVSGAAKTLAVPAQLINGQLMVPVQFAAEALNCGYTWYAGTQTAAVTNITRGTQIYITPTGKKYHFDGNCNGGTYNLSTLAEALSLGLTPCQKCVLSNSRYSQLGNPSPPAPSTPAPAQSPVQTQAPGPTTTPPAVPTPAPPVQPSAPVTQTPAPTTPTVTQPAQPQAPAAQGVPPVQPSPPAQTPPAASQSTYQGPAKEPLWLIVDRTQDVPAVVRPERLEPANDSKPGTPSWLVL